MSKEIDPRTATTGQTSTVGDQPLRQAAAEIRERIIALMTPELHASNNDAYVGLGDAVDALTEVVGDDA